MNGLPNIHQYSVPVFRLDCYPNFQTTSEELQDYIDEKNKAVYGIPIQKHENDSDQILDDNQIGAPALNPERFEAAAPFVQLGKRAKQVIDFDDDIEDEVESIQRTIQKDQEAAGGIATKPEDAATMAQPQPAPLSFDPNVNQPANQERQQQQEANNANQQVPPMSFNPEYYENDKQQNMDDDESDKGSSLFYSD